MERWKKPEVQKTPGALRFEELLEKDRRYLITDEEAVELARLKRLGRIASAKKRGAQKAAAEAETQADIQEANDTMFAEMRATVKRRDRADLIHKAWLEGAPRDILDDEGNVILNPEYPMKKIELPPMD